MRGLVVKKSFDEMVRILNLENIKDRRKALDERKRAWKETRDPYTPPQRGEFSALNPWEMTPEFLERMETLVWLQRRLNSLAKSDDGSGKLDAETEANAMREVGLAAATMLEPVYVRAFLTEQRTRQSALNLEIVLGLAAFHADNQRYPEQLADLEPKYLPVAPVDLFSLGKHSSIAWRTTAACSTVLVKTSETTTACSTSADPTTSECDWTTQLSSDLLALSQSPIFNSTCSR